MRLHCQSTSIIFCLTAVVLLGACERKAVPELPPTIATPPMETSAAPADRPADAPSTKPTAKVPEPREAETSPAELAQRLRTAAEPDERSEAVSQLWTLATPEAVELLRQHFFVEQDTHVKADIVAGVVEEQKPETRELRFGLLSAALTPAQAADVRIAATSMVTDFDDVRAVALLQNLLQDSNEEIREAARDAIEERREREAK